MLQPSLKRLAPALPACALAFVGCVIQWQLHSVASWAIWMLVCAAIVLPAAMLKTERSVLPVATALGMLFALFMVVGREIHYYETIERLVDTHEMPRAIVRVLGLTVLNCSSIKLLYCTVLKSRKGEDVCKPSFPLIWFVIFACWLPYFVAYYPGCVSNDSLMEIQSMLGQLPLNNHHPLIHQWTIAPFVLLGNAVGSLKLGVALYSLFQMAVMSAIFAYALWDLNRRETALWLRIVVFVWVALHTVNAFYSISMWKDVLFGGITLLLVMQLMRLCERDQTEKASLRSWVQLGATLFLFCLYRNNGYYAFLFAVPFFILFNRRWWKPLLAVGLAVFVAVQGYQTLIFDVLGAQKSKAGESLSVPLQQIARTVRYHHRNVTEEEMQILEEIFPSVEEVRWAYIPHISDPVKDLFQSDVFSANPMRYAKVWLKLGLRHPLVYLDAFLYQGHGYWYPNTPYWTVFPGIYENEMGLKTPETAATKTLGTLHDQLEWNKITGWLYRPGSYVWLVLIACGLLICKRRVRLLTPMLFLLGIWLTTLLSPVYAEYRYVYGIIVSAPYLLSVAQSIKTKA